MSEWVRLCSAAEAPADGQVIEGGARGVAICLAKVNGELRALDNWCPHRKGPLGQGWVEGNAVVCPWHSWAFDSLTGIAEPPERARVEVIPVKIESEEIFVNITTS